MPAGRPKKYNTAEELQVMIDAYYADCERREVPLTVEGLANACDMVRDTLLEYSKDDEFSDTIKKAKQKVYQQVTEGLLLKGHSNYIFYIKNNIPNYKDASEKNINVTSQNKTLAERLEESERLELLEVIDDDDDS